MDFRMLGPFEVRHRGTPVELGRRRGERCLLGLLLLDTGRVVLVDRLADLLWDDGPPDNARAIIQTHLARLRAVLDPARDGSLGVRLLRRGEGYLVEAAPEDVDVHRFRAQVERARQLPDAGRGTALRAALALWRGPLLADAATDRLRDRVGGGLAELRLTALEDCVSAELAQGRHRELIAELTDRPETLSRERLAAVLMTALHRAGRQGEALAVYQRVRDRLAEELGLDPPATLTRLRDAIVRDEPLPGEPQRIAGPAPARPLPAQLPPAARHFTGRAAPLDDLDRLLDDTDGTTTVVISAIAGTAGVGKTTLAVTWSQRVAGRFPDGQLYLDLRGYTDVGPPVAAGEAVRGFLDALGVPPERVPPALDAQVSLYRSLLADRRMLVVLDNARDAEQVRPLLPGGPYCRVVVTSRDRLAGLVAGAGAHPISLALFSADEGRELLARRLGAGRVAAEPEAVATILAHCAGLPLAVAVVAARAVLEPGLALSVVAGQLADTDPLTAFGGADPATDVRGVLSWSYRALSPAAARLFRLLGLHPGPDLSAPAAAGLAELTVPAVRALLAELTDAHLVQESPPGRYTCHDLLRAYAVELAERHEPPAERQAALRRSIDHYLHTGHQAALRLFPEREPLPLPDRAPGAATEPIADYAAAMAWFTAERQVLRSAAAASVAAGLDEHTGWLAWTMRDFCYRRGHWRDWIQVQQAALTAATRRGDPGAQAASHLDLGRAHAQLRDDQPAHDHFDRAYRLFLAGDDSRQQAQALHGAAWLFSHEGRYDEAVARAEQALALLQGIGDKRAQAYALNNLGWYRALLGDLPSALKDCRQALELQRELADRPGQAPTWDSLGYIHSRRGEYPEAADCYRQALDVRRELGDRYNEAATLAHLGDVHHAAGDSDAADLAWRAALDLFEELGHPDAAAVRTKLARPEDAAR